VKTETYTANNHWYSTDFLDSEKFLGMDPAPFYDWVRGKVGFEPDAFYCWLGDKINRTKEALTFDSRKHWWVPAGSLVLALTGTMYAVLMGLDPKLEAKAVENKRKKNVGDYMLKYMGAADKEVKRAGDKAKETLDAKIDNNSSRSD